jgi:hypothetical protein
VLRHVHRASASPTRVAHCTRCEEAHRATLPPPARTVTCDADEFGEREGDAQAQDSNSGRSIRGDDHNDGQAPFGRAGTAKRLGGRVLRPPARSSSAHATTHSKPHSDEQVPPKDSVSEPSGLQHGVAAPTRPHARNPKANRKRNGNGKEQSSEAPAAPEEAVRQSRLKPAVPPAQRLWARLTRR